MATRIVLRIVIFAMSLRRDIDTVLIATPDHWHAILSIEAAKAGKDIYCEKPISLTVAEGRAVADTMKRYGTVYQSGTQRRSIACFRFGVDIARSGMLGKLHTLHCYYHNGPTCPPQPVQPIPDGFDYDMWLGPAPFEPYTVRRCHGSFRWIYDYSGGQLTDLGRISRTWPSGRTASRTRARHIMRAGPSSPKMGCGTRPCGSKSPPRMPTA